MRYTKFLPLLLLSTNYIFSAFFDICDNKEKTQVKSEALDGIVFDVVMLSERLDIDIRDILNQYYNLDKGPRSYNICVVEGKIHIKIYFRHYCSTFSHQQFPGGFGAAPIIDKNGNISPYQDIRLYADTTLSDPELLPNFIKTVQVGCLHAPYYNQQDNTSFNLIQKQIDDLVTVYELLHKHNMLKHKFPEKTEELSERVEKLIDSVKLPFVEFCGKYEIFKIFTEEIIEKYKLDLFESFRDFMSKIYIFSNQLDKLLDGSYKQDDEIYKAFMSFIGYKTEDEYTQMIYLKLYNKVSKICSIARSTTEATPDQSQTRNRDGRIKILTLSEQLEARKPDGRVKIRIFLKEYSYIFFPLMEDLEPNFMEHELELIRGIVDFDDKYKMQDISNIDRFIEILKKSDRFNLNLERYIRDEQKKSFEILLNKLAKNYIEKRSFGCDMRDIYQYHMTMYAILDEDLSTDKEWSVRCDISDRSDISDI